MNFKKAVAGFASSFAWLFPAVDYTYLHMQGPMQIARWARAISNGFQIHMEVNYDGKFLRSNCVWEFLLESI